MPNVPVCALDAYDGLSPQVTDRVRLHVPFFLKIGFKFITYTHTLDGHSNFPVRITVLFLKRKQKDITISMINNTLKWRRRTNG